MRLLFAPMLLLGSILPVPAADLQSDEQPSLKIEPHEFWDGFYVGLNAGTNSGVHWLQTTPSQEVFASFPSLMPSESESLRHSVKDRHTKVIGGIHAGYNKTVGRLVVGAEADLSFSGLDQRRRRRNAVTTSYSGGVPRRMEEVESLFTYTTEIQQQVDWLATARIRLGFAPADRVLAYATGGLAVAGTQSSVTAELVPAAALLPPEVQARYDWEDSSVQIGGAVGGGIEYALTDRFSIRAEYIHARFGGGTQTIKPDTTDNLVYPVPATAAMASTPDPNYPPPVHPNATIEVQERSRFNIFRVGLTYKF